METLISLPEKIDALKACFEHGVEVLCENRGHTLHQSWDDKDWENPSFVMAVKEYGEKAYNEMLFSGGQRSSLKDAIENQSWLLSQALIETDQETKEGGRPGLETDDFESLIAFYGEFIIYGFMCSVYKRVYDFLYGPAGEGHTFKNMAKVAAATAARAA